MKKYFLLIILIFTSSTYAFDSFETEHKKVTKQINCKKPKITPASGSWGALYGCVGGKEETVKFFINEKSGKGETKNIKFLWNDWTKDIGHGVHTDAKLTKSWVGELANMYAPKKKKEIISTFLGNVNKTIETENYSFKYTYFVGPAIDERMYIITKK